MESTKEAVNAAHWSVLHHLIGLINKSGLGELIVLRGSLLMKAWYGNIARNPADVDWICCEEKLPNAPSSFRDRLSFFLRSVAKYPAIGDLTITARKIVGEPISIGTEYQAFVGRRLTFPWRGPGNIAGKIQMDFAFDETLHILPSWAAIPNPFGEETRVLAVSKQESLAWKIFWLQRDAERWGYTETRPKGKDLYDAVLLAEDTFLPLDLLLRVTQKEYYFVDSGSYDSEAFPLIWDVDWEPFQKANPQVTGTANDWQMRLAYALAPTFTQEEKERAETSLSFGRSF